MKILTPTFSLSTLQLEHVNLLRQHAVTLRVFHDVAVQLAKSGQVEEARNLTLAGQQVAHDADNLVDTMLDCHAVGPVDKHQPWHILMDAHFHESNVWWRMLIARAEAGGWLHPDVEQ